MMASYLRLVALAGAGIAGLTGVVGALKLAAGSGSEKRKRRPSSDLLSSDEERDETLPWPAHAVPPSKRNHPKRLKESCDSCGAGSTPNSDLSVGGNGNGEGGSGAPFPLLELVDQPVFLDVCKHLSAKDIACLRVTSSELVRNVNGAEAAHWAANTRDWKAIYSIHRAGDLPLEMSKKDGWTLERLHLAEEPPRFSQMEFGFASHALQQTHSDGTVHCLENVASLMARHPGIRISVTGYTQPDCPFGIAVRISASRAAMVSLYIACRLCGLAVTSRNLQVTRNLLAELPKIHVLSRKGDDTIRSMSWGHEGAFRTFDIDFWSDSEEGYSDSDTDDLPDEDGSEEGEAEASIGEEDMEGRHAQQASSPDRGRAAAQGMVSVMAPKDWDVSSLAFGRGGKLSPVSPGRMKWHRVPGAMLREQLNRILDRIEQIAGHNTAPKNSNWMEMAQVDLSLDRRVEFTLLSV